MKLEKRGCWHPSSVQISLIQRAFCRQRLPSFQGKKPSFGGSFPNHIPQSSLFFSLRFQHPEPRRMQTSGKADTIPLAGCSSTIR